MKKLLAVLLALLFPVYLHAAVARVAMSTGQQAADDFSFSHTVSAGTNRMILLACAFEDINPDIFTVPPTFDGVPFTLAGTKNHSVSQSTVEFYTLVAPNVTTADIVISMVVADDIACFAINFTGVRQSVPTTSATGAEISTADTSSISVTCPAADYAFDIIASVTAADFTADGENTEVAGGEFDATAFSMSMSEDTSPDGTVTMSWTMAATEIGTHLGICIKAATDDVPAGPTWFK